MLWWLNDMGKWNVALKTVWIVRAHCAQLSLIQGLTVLVLFNLFSSFHHFIFLCAHLFFLDTFYFLSTFLCCFHLLQRMSMEGPQSTKYSPLALLKLLRRTYTWGAINWWCWWCLCFDDYADDIIKILKSLDYEYWALTMKLRL